MAKDNSKMFVGQLSVSVKCAQPSRCAVAWLNPSESYYVQTKKTTRIVNKNHCMQIVITAVYVGEKNKDNATVTDDLGSV